MSSSAYKPRRRHARKHSPRSNTTNKQNQPSRLDVWLGLDSPDAIDRTIRITFGILIPFLIVWFAVSGFVTGETVFYGRGGRLILTGWAAAWASLGYLCLGLLIHVQAIWMTHQLLSRLAEATRYILVLLMGMSMLGIVWGVLM